MSDLNKVLLTKVLGTTRLCSMFYAASRSMGLIFDIYSKQNTYGECKRSFFAAYILTYIYVHTYALVRVGYLNLKANSPNKTIFQHTIYLLV